MTESKAKRLTVSLTCGAVLLLVLLLSVLVYQLISIKVYNDKNASLDAEIAKYERLLEDDKKTYEARKQLSWVKFRARELGLVDKLDRIYGE